MISPIDVTVIDFRNSYPIDECVAKMIGWMHGAERLEKIKVDERGILPDMLPHIYSLVSTLDEQLDELKERARLELFDAADAYADAIDGSPEKELLADVIDQKYIAIDKCSEIIERAHTYILEVRKELAKGELSQLRIDRVEKNNEDNDVIYIMLDSLDEWVICKFGKPINEMSSLLGADSINLNPQSDLLNNNIPDPKAAPIVRNKIRRQEASILDAIRSLGYDPTELPKRIKGMSWVKCKVELSLKGNNLFSAKTAFDKAWQNLRDFSDIKEIK